MSEKIIKWGFIGCGEVTKKKSGPAFQKVEGSEVVAVMSRDGAKAKAYAKERGIKKWYDDAQELIDDPEVNAIYIATPPSSHATYAIMAMKLSCFTRPCSFKTVQSLPFSLANRPLFARRLSRTRFFRT